MKEITISDLRKRMKYYLNFVIESSEILMAPGTNENDAVVILSLKEYNALTETNYLLSTKVNRIRLRESILQAENKKDRDSTS